jgi:hypothetical protein
VRIYGCQINKPRRSSNYPRRGHSRETTVTYTLYRINDDETTTPVSTHPTIGDGVAAGVEMVERVDLNFAYALHTQHGRVASFRDGRTGYRMWATRTGRISPSVEDRWDRDEDEFLA